MRRRAVRRGGELGARGARFWKGLLAVWLGGGVGQSLAFLLARYLVGDWVSALVRGKSKKWDVVRPAALRSPARSSCPVAGGLLRCRAGTVDTEELCCLLAAQTASVHQLRPFQ